jgi:hypothetical protein
MSAVERYHQNHYVWGIYTLIVGGSLLLTPMLLSQYGYSPLKIFLATVLLLLCLYPTVHHAANRESGLPAFPVLCLAYGLLYAVPVFTREPLVQLAYGQTAEFDEGSVTAALLLSILGVCSLLAGYYGFQRTRLAENLPGIGLSLDEKKAIVYCVVVGVFAPMLSRVEEFLPETLVVQLSALIKIVQNQALVAIGILGYLIYSSRRALWQRVLLYWIIGVTVLQGLSKGMIELAIAPIAALFVVQWQLTKRLPIPSIIAAIVLILFLSPVKHEYRSITWTQDSPVADSHIDKTLLWVSQATEYWINTFSGQQSLAEATEQVASRTDLIHQFALVRSLTPSEIPYQNGATYTYFLVTLIPRAIWPEKPEAGSANKFFAVNYGLTTEEGAQRATFGVSLLAEGYINFGWVGVILVMAFQGVFLTLLQRLFGEQRSGEGGRAVYASFLVFFLNGIGSSADMLLGNVIQSALLSCALLWWMRRNPASRKPEKTLLAVPAAQS